MKVILMFSRSKIRNKNINPHFVYELTKTLKDCMNNIFSVRKQYFKAVRGILSMRKSHFKCEEYSKCERTTL